MKGSATPDNRETVEENGRLTTPASRERRPSVEALHNTLKRVSQSPFQRQYQMGDVSSAADSHRLTYSGQNGLPTTLDNDLPAAAQNGANRASPRDNAFYSYYLKTSTKSPEDGNPDASFVSPPEFQSSPVDRPDTSSVQNHQTHYKPENDLFHGFAPKPAPDIFQTRHSLSSDFRDVTLESPDLFKPAQSPNLRNGFQSESQDLFQPAKTEDLSQANQSPSVSDILSRTRLPTTNTNPFYSSANGKDVFDTASSKNDGLFGDKENRSPAFAKNADVFSAASNEKLDIFSPSAGSDFVDPFASPVTRTIDFSSFEDPFADSPLKLSDPFQDASLDTSDIFKPFSPKTDEVSDAFKVKTSRPKPPRPVPPARAPKPTSPSSENPQEIVLTTPQGSQRSILQPTPFAQAAVSQADSQSVSPSQSPKLTHVPTFKRPPKPLPRIRRRRTSTASMLIPPEIPPKPEKPAPPEKPDDPEPTELKSPEPSPLKPPRPTMPKLSPKRSIKPLIPKPVIRRKPKAENKTLSPENYVVFEDILLIGQEQCVEDWPEDSPEQQPDFKPRGTLRLRRESLMVKTDSECEDQDGPGSSTKKKDKKFKMSIPSRRDSKDRSSDEFTSRSRTYSGSRKSSKDYFAETHTSAEDLKNEENEDLDQWADYKKPHFKDKVNSLLRRSSAAASFSEQKQQNGHVPHDSKGHEFKKSQKDSSRRWSEGTMLDLADGESGDDIESKKNRKLKMKFGPPKGFVFPNKHGDDEPKGAHGYTPQKGSKEDLFGAHSNYATRKKSQDDGIEEMKSHTLQSLNKAAFMSDEFSEKSSHSSAGLNGDEEAYEEEELKPKKTPKNKPFPLPRKIKAKHVTPEQTGYPSSPQQDFNDEFDEDYDSLKGKPALSPAEMYNFEEDELDICEPKKTFKLKGFKKPKFKSKSAHLETEDPPGATSSDYMSEAARAELKAAEKDREAMGDFEDGDEEGDTDSLMEWWDTVEQWDEVPSDEEEMVLQEDESKSFSILADKVHRGLRLFNKVFMERAEVLWQSVITLHAIADDISTFHNKARIAGITGGTTTAVGGVAAIAGLALAPLTFGASLVVTAVGVGVATAGGIASASAAISDNVNNANDRKKVEALLQENEVHLLELSKILHFSNTGLYKLRGHPFLRSGTQHYSQDWEVRRAVQMISLVDTPVMKATDFIDSTVSSVQGLFQGMDKYFLKDSRELKKGCKKEIVGQIKDVANVLNDCIVELNGVREELQDAIGDV